MTSRPTPTLPDPARIEYNPPRSTWPLVILGWLVCLALLVLCVVMAVRSA